MISILPWPRPGSSRCFNRPRPVSQSWRARRIASGRLGRGSGPFKGQVQLASFHIGR